MESAQDCVTGADIAITMTSARDPVLQGDWLMPGAHVNAAGGNHWMRREIDEETVTRSNLIVVDDLEQAKAECGDLMAPKPEALSAGIWLTSCGTLVSGKVPGRPSDQSITLFESMGVALEDIAAAQLVFHKAVDQGIGVELPF